MYTYLTTVMYKEDSNAGAGVQADTSSSLYFTEIPMENNDRFNPIIKLNATDASSFSNVNYALIHWPDEVEPRRYFINYKRVTDENTIELGLNQDYLSTFAAFINEQTALVTEATEPNSVVTVAETANIPVKSEIPVNEASETVELIPLSTPFIERTRGASSTGSGIVVFGTSLQEVTNTTGAPNNKENFFKGFWTAEIANVHYYAVTMRSFVDLVKAINEKLLSLDNDKGKYDAFQQAIASIIYLPLDTTSFDGVTNLQYIPRYIMPENYVRDDDGTVKYYDSDSNTYYTVHCSYDGNMIQMAEPIFGTVNNLKVDTHGCVVDSDGHYTVKYMYITFKLPYDLADSTPFGNTVINVAVMPYNLDLDYFNVNNPLGTTNIPERGLGPYVAKIDFEASIDDAHFLADTYPRALNLEPYTTLKAHLGPFGMIDVPLTKVYEPTENSTTAVYLSFTLCIDITNGDAILYVKASDGSNLAILQANIAQELALGSVSNNGVTHLSLMTKALGVMAGASVAGASGASRLNAPVDMPNTALQSAAVFDPSIKHLAEIEAAAPLVGGGALVGALAGGVGAALSVLTTSQNVQRKYTKFSGWLSESARAFYFEIKRIMPLFNDPDIIPDLYPIFKSMTLSSWLGHKIKAFLNKPVIPDEFARLIPTKAELDVITKKLYSGVWLETDTMPPLPEHYCTIIVPAGVTLQRSVPNSGVIKTKQGPATVYIDLSNNVEIATVQSTLITSSDGWNDILGGYNVDHWRFGNILLTSEAEGDILTIELPESSTETFVYTLSAGILMTALAEDSSANNVSLSAPGEHSLSHSNYQFATMGENPFPVLDVLNDVLIQPGANIILPAADNSYIGTCSITVGEDVTLSVDSGSGNPTTYSGPTSAVVPYTYTCTADVDVILHNLTTETDTTVTAGDSFALASFNEYSVEKKPETVTWKLYFESIGSTAGYRSEIYTDPNAKSLNTNMEYTSQVGDTLTLKDRRIYGVATYAKLYDSLNTLIAEYTAGGYYGPESVSFAVPANLACIVYDSRSLGGGV